MQSAIVTPERPRQTTSKLAYDHEKQGKNNRNNLHDGSDVYFFESQHVFFRRVRPAPLSTAFELQGSAWVARNRLHRTFTTGDRAMLKITEKNFVMAVMTTSFNHTMFLSEGFVQILYRQRSSSEVRPECPEIVCTEPSRQAIEPCIMSSETYHRHQP